MENTKDFPQQVRIQITKILRMNKVWPKKLCKQLLAYKDTKSNVTDKQALRL